MGAVPVVPTDLLILAHHAFAPPTYQPSADALLRYETTLQRWLPRDARSVDGNLWAIGAGLVLLQGQLQVLPWFLSRAWEDNAPAACRRTVETLVDFWNHVAEPLPTILERTVVAEQYPARDAGSREHAHEILQSMLSRHLKFNLGVRLLVHLRQQLAWVDRTLQGEGERSIAEVVAWASQLDPKDALDHWVEEVDPGHKVGVIAGARAALLRDLSSLRSAILDWGATMTTASTETDHLPAQHQALESLQDTLRREFTSWYDGWGAAGAPCLGRPLLKRIHAVVLSPTLP